MLTTLKKLIIPFIVIVLAFVLYTVFIKKDGSTSLLKKESPTNGDVLGAEIIKAINQISTLKLDRSIFSDPIFKTLIDRSEELTPEPIGRVNPFAPIGSTGATPATTTSATPARVNR